MNVRLLGFVVVFVLSFVAGIALTQLFLKNTSPSEGTAHKRPTVVTEGPTDPNYTPTVVLSSNVEQHKATPSKAVQLPSLQPKKPVRRTWWRDLAGRQCHVNLGTSSSLRIRAGTLQDGAQISWVESFANQPQVGTLFNESNSVVLVHAVGINAKGLPEAAQITHTAGGRQVTGIIALSIKDLQVTLYPVDGKN